MVAIQVKNQRQMKSRFLCHQCKGRKSIPDWFYRVCTLGIGVLIGEDERERQTCPTCKGKGYLEL